MVYRVTALFLVPILIAFPKEEEGHKRAFEKAAKKRHPLILIASPTKNSKFCQDFQKLIKTKEGKRAVSGAEVAFLPTKCEEDEDEHKKLLKTFELRPDEEAIVVCDYQGVVVKSFKGVPNAKVLGEAVKRAKEVCRRKKKVMRKIKKLFKKAETAYKREDYKTAGLYCREIRRIKKSYEKKHPEDRLRSSVFETMRRWAKEVREKAVKLLSEASLQLESGNFGGAMAKAKEAEKYKGFDPELDWMIETQIKDMEKMIKEQNK